MQCKIADLTVDVPETGGLAPRCQEYLCDKSNGADIIIRTDLYNRDLYRKGISENTLAYMESARQFYGSLLNYDGFYLHSSALELDGKVYLFSGHSGVGKSTHARLWMQMHGDKCRIINDDKPALRYMDGHWIAYGTPWCGKDGINQNRKAPLAGICFLKQSDRNHIRQLEYVEAIQKILPQTIYRFKYMEKLDLLLGHIEYLVREIPIFELENRPEPEAAILSYETMSQKAKEMGL